MLIAWLKMALSRRKSAVAPARSAYRRRVPLVGGELLEDRVVPSATQLTPPSLHAPVVNASPIVLTLSEDAWKGDAQFSAAVDGRPVGILTPAGTVTRGTVTALHSQGLTQAFTLAGSYPAGSHAVTVTFLNDAWGGPSSVNQDRNLYVNGVSFEGGTAPGAALNSNGSRTFTVGQAAPPAIARTPTATVSADGKSAALAVLGTAAAGEASLSYRWTATDSGVKFSANGTNAAKATTATFTHAGTYTLTVTETDTAGMTASATVAVTVNQLLRAITVSPGAGSVVDGGTLSLTAAGVDQFGAAYQKPLGAAWSVASGPGSVSAAGVFTAPATGAGTTTVVATSGGVSGHAVITVTDPRPTVATAAAASALTNGGTRVNLSALGASSAGEAGLTYTWTAQCDCTSPTFPGFSANGTNAAKNTTVTFHRAGSYTFTVTIADARQHTVTSAVTVTVGQHLTTVTVAPANPSVVAGSTVQLSATAVDQFGATLTTAPQLTWSVLSGQSLGSVNSAGLFTSAGVGQAVVAASATSAGVSVMGWTIITVMVNGPSLAQGVTSSPLSADGTQVTLSTLGADPAGEASLKYTWALTYKPQSAPAPKLSDNGTNSAKTVTATFAASGTYGYTVTITDAAGKSTSASVYFTLAQRATAVVITPGSVNVIDCSSLPLTAQVTDQFGAPIQGSTATFQWSVAGQGSVSPAGVYTAPATGSGTATVTAVSGSFRGTATIGYVPSTDWFGQNLRDAGIQALARADFARDGAITRADLIGLYTEAVTEDGQTGTVTADQIHDFQTLLAAGGSLGESAAVLNLSSKLVNGSPANATYQGAALGNLSTASTGGQLGKLVGKWFLGTDLPTDVGYTLAGSTWSLWGANGPVYHDVAQGGVGDCYYLASLAEVAFQSPQAIKDMFTDNGDGTFTVRFFTNNNTPDYVTVDRHLANGVARYGSTNMWVNLAEKAFVELAAEGWSRGPNMAPLYKNIWGGGSELGLLTGRTFEYFSLPSTNPGEALQSQISAGHMLWAACFGTAGGMISSHAYAVIGYNATTQKYDLYNPWGYDQYISYADLMTDISGSFYGVMSAASAVTPGGTAAVLAGTDRTEAAVPAGGVVAGLRALAPPAAEYFGGVRRQATGWETSEPGLVHSAGAEETSGYAGFGGSTGLGGWPQS